MRKVATARFRIYRNPKSDRAQAFCGATMGFGRLWQIYKARASCRSRKQRQVVNQHWNSGSRPYRLYWFERRETASAPPFPAERWYGPMIATCEWSRAKHLWVSGHSSHLMYVSRQGSFSTCNDMKVESTYKVDGSHKIWRHYNTGSPPGLVSASSTPLNQINANSL